MRKIPTIYKRDPETNLRYVKPEPADDVEWVFTGEGLATYKWNGTAVAIDNHHPTYRVWKRRQVKRGAEFPDDYWQTGPPDPMTGKIVGWVPARADAPEDKLLFDTVVESELSRPLTDGTYELVGPEVQGNPHRFGYHHLLRHGESLAPLSVTVVDVAMLEGFVALAATLHAIRERQDPGFEGVVWHHPDGRMAKIKVSDFPEVGA